MSATAPTPPAPPAQSHVRQPNVRDAAIGVCMVLLGCCTNVWTLELISNTDPACGNLITFGHIAVVVVVGLFDFYVFPFSFKPRLAPLTAYLKITALYFLSALLNNKAVGYAISIPMHTVFRSSGLVATYVLGRFWYGVKYAPHHLYASLLTTVGIVWITLADSSVHKAASTAAEATTATTTMSTSPSSNSSSSSSSPLVCGVCTGVGSVAGLIHPQLEAALAHVCDAVVRMIAAIVPPSLLPAGATASTLLASSTSLLSGVSPIWLIGVSMLVAGLVLGAFLGHEQERLYKRHAGPTPIWREALFYTNAMSLPAFLPILPDLVGRITQWVWHAPRVPLFASAGSSAGAGVELSLIALFALNMATQLACIRGVALISSNADSLTTQLVLTLRKMLSLFLSIALFQTPFTMAHWLGAALVFSGVLVYTQGGGSRSPSSSNSNGSNIGSTSSSTSSTSSSNGSNGSNATTRGDVVGATATSSVKAKTS